MLALLRVVILIADPGTPFFRRKIFAQMRIKKQNPLAQVLHQPAAEIRP
jgi:hypothetical protein